MLVINDRRRCYSSVQSFRNDNRRSDRSGVRRNHVREAVLVKAFERRTVNRNALQHGRVLGAYQRSERIYLIGYIAVIRLDRNDRRVIHTTGLHEYRLLGIRFLIFDGE